jgi:hypothetical protein
MPKGCMIVVKRSHIDAYDCMTLLAKAFGAKVGTHESLLDLVARNVHDDEPVVNASIDYLVVVLG